jgi:hypothetical protein
MATLADTVGEVARMKILRLMRSGERGGEMRRRRREGSVVAVPSCKRRQIGVGWKLTEW